MSRNLGSTSLGRKSRTADPMRSYDALPAPLRNWLAQASLPWSSASARRVWNRACAKGLSPDEALSKLSNAEARTLARDRSANSQHLPAKF
ncbi:DUF6525 family protein [Tateyamaria sp. Alg231-49]|uniref:DUF6525 family protein n=1 Tax=Tateyamaria sp. Alg231-49 TaxID=1922219 RepID=UPI000D55A51A|nr:DUF6525 family protein [Tateyamaria sp. Alg231-49]